MISLANHDHNKARKNKRLIELTKFKDHFYNQVIETEKIEETAANSSEERIWAFEPQEIENVEKAVQKLTSLKHTGELWKHMLNLDKEIIKNYYSIEKVCEFTL